MPRSDITTGYLALAGDTTVFPRVIDYLAGVAVGGTALVSAMLPPTATAGERTRLRRVSPLTLTLNGGFGRVSVAITNADLTETANIAASVTTWIGKTATLYKWITIDEGLITEQFENVALLVGIVTGYRLDETGLEIDLVTRANRASTLSNRRVGSKCPWTFKGTECGYSGVETTCNKLYDDTGGCSGRSNQHRFGGFPDRAGVETIGRISGLGAAPAYQLVQLDTTYTEQRTTLRFDDTFTVTDDPTTNATVITAVGGGGGGDATPDWIDVKEDHNAVGDGVADDTAEIQAAIDAAETAGGGVVYLPAGTYKITATLDLGPNQIILLGDGPGVSIISMATSNIPIIEITGYSANNISIRDLRITGPGPTTGTSGHGIYVHDNTYEIPHFWLDNIQVIDCGGHGIYVTGHFTNEYEKVLVSNCGLNAFDLAGNNTIMLRSCYADDVNDGGVGYRVHGGQLLMTNCNGLDSLGATTDWGVFGNSIADGDASDGYVQATLINCNIESFKRYGVRCKTGSAASFHGCSWVTSTSGSNHIAIKTDYTGDRTGQLIQPRMDVQGTGTWANGHPIHGTDRPITLVGTRHAGDTNDYSLYWNDGAAASYRLPQASPEMMLSQFVNVKADYGAFGDDTNETTKIQAAIDAVEAAGGGVVYFPPGLYRVTGLTVSGNVRLLGESHHRSKIKSVTNGIIIDCSASSSHLPQIQNLRIIGNHAGNSQIGIKMDDLVYGLQGEVRNVYIEDCGGAGLYIGNAFSSHFENIYSTNCAGGNFIINSANMPALTLSHCDSGVINDSYRTGYHIKAGNVTMRDCNSVYGGDNPEWCVTIGRRIGQYGEATANGSAFARFEGCNFESSEIGGVQCFYNSRASFHNCTWVGAGGSSGSYVAVQYDVCQYNPTETTGDITSGTNALTVADAVTWSNGQGIQVAGAGVGGADLTTTVSNVSGTSFTLAANASTTVDDAVVSHTDDIYYPATQTQLGVIDDDCGFSQGPASYYADSEPIHITAYPSGAAAIPPLAVNGRGPRIAGDKFVSNFRNDTTDKTWPLPRTDGYMPVQTITASTTYTAPGVRYIECNHSAPITITLPWAGWTSQNIEPIIIKDRSSAGAATNNITIAASSGSVNGSSYTINADKGAVILLSNGADDYRVVSAYTGAAGNVTGPVSATDTAIAKFNGATGKVIQNSGVTIDGSNNINTAGNLTAQRVTATAELVSGDGYFTGYYSSAGAAPSVLIRRARGTSGTPAAVQSGDIFAYFGQSGYDGSGFAAGTYLFGVASENWTGSAHGTNICLTSTANGATDQFSKGVRLDPTNATWEPYGDAGLSLGRASYRFVDAHLTGNVTLYERSAPSTPAANSLVLYAKDKSGTSALYYKNDAGTETELGAAGANTALSNLASVAINTSLLPGADNTHDLGSASYSWRDAYIERDALLGRQIQSSGSALSASAGTGAGTGPSITIDGNAIAGAIILTTGTSPATSAQIVQMTMAASFTTYPVVIITPANAAAAALTGNKQVFIDDAAMLANKWTLKSGSTALDATTDYVWYFHVMGI